jgi:hypothetical protein
MSMLDPKQFDVNDDSSMGYYATDQKRSSDRRNVTEGRTDHQGSGESLQDEHIDGTRADECQASKDIRVTLNLPGGRWTLKLDSRFPEQLQDVFGQFGGNRSPACGEHYAVGMEIPASLVRARGRRLVWDLLDRMYRTAIAEDPDVRVSYFNLPRKDVAVSEIQDFICFNLNFNELGMMKAFLARIGLMIAKGSQGKHKGKELVAQTA